MVKKSLLTALVLLVAYHFLLPNIPRRFYQLGGQQRANYFRTQQYVHDVPAETSVILGSSMSLELNEETLGPGYFKLTLPGGSVLTSLEIIRTIGKRPPVVLIETNFLNKDADKELLHDLFSPWLFELRRYSPIFKEEGRPSNFLNGIAEAFVRRGSRWGSRVLAGKRPVDPSLQANTVSPALFSQLLRAQQEQLDEPPLQEDLIKRSNRLANYVDALTQSGSTCIFFEMPMDSSLEELALPTTLRRKLKQRFPPEKYHWLSFEHNHNYKTTDGVHLVRAEADRLTEILINQVNQIMHQPQKPESNSQQMANTPGNSF